MLTKNENESNTISHHHGSYHYNPLATNDNGLRVVDNAINGKLITLPQNKLHIYSIDNIKK
jgi:hypothetical protein